MGIIRQLPPAIANRIAAGEVVERPASVVKELVENAIDAGATRIDVELEDAGKQLIRISDNGCGMDQDDLALCFSDHATSKISDSDDLFYIDTMGFRGEALASIGSISRARITSRTHDSDDAYQIVNEGGEIGEVRPAAGAPGTVIEVENLFYNVPARRRYLRQNSTEVSHIVEAMQRTAMSWPAIGFSLSNDGKQSFKLPPKQSRKERILEFAGSKLADDLIEVNDFDDYCALTGFISSINQHKPNSRWLNLFVNGRFIRDRSLLHAVTLAYREFIPHGRYPMAWLFLEIDPSEVDVNVHPTKIEVRFVQANKIFSKIKAACQEAVLRSGMLPRISLEDQRIEQVRALKAGNSQAELHAAVAGFISRTDRQRAATQNAAPQTYEARPGNQHEPGLGYERSGYDSPEEESVGESKQAPSFLNQQQLRDARPMREKAIPSSLSNQALNPAPDVQREIEQPVPHKPGEQADSPAQQHEQLSNLPPARQSGLLEGAKGLFQVGDTYLVVETADGMMLIDQHAYHERILFWQLEHRIKSAKPEMQRLLVPEPLELSKAAAAVLDEHRPLFREFGFEIEPFGSGGWAVYALPRYVRTSKVNEFVASCLEELALSGRSKDVAELRKSMVEMMACRAAIKAGDALEGHEIESLLEEGAKVPHTFACPHGRPTTFKLSFGDLEKIFHRR